MKPNSALFWPRLIIAASLLTAIFYLIGASSFLRTFVALGFLFICPGMAIIPLLRLGDLSQELSIGIALSLVLDAVVAAGALYLRLWYPGAVLAVLIGLALTGASLQLWQARKVTVAA